MKMKTNSKPFIIDIKCRKNSNDLEIVSNLDKIELLLTLIAIIERLCDNEDEERTTKIC